MNIKKSVTSIINTINNGKSFLNKNVNKVVDLQELNELLTTGSKLGELVIAYNKSKGVAGKIKSGLDLIHFFTSVNEEKIVDNYENDIENYISQEDWIWIFDAKLANIIYNHGDTKPILKYSPPEKSSMPSTALSSNTKNDKYGFYTFLIGEYEIGYLGYKEEKNISILYVKNEDSKNAKDNIIEYLSNKIWKKFNSNHLEIIKVIDRNQVYFNLIVDEDIEYFPSSIGEEISKEIEAFTKNNVHRTILLLGPPGTGKSTAIKYITNKLNYTSLRISNEVIENDLLQLVQVIKPDILIVDDFDRVSKQRFLLDFMTKLKKNTKAFLISCNFFDKLEPAMKRPGRIDNIYYIEKLDKDVIDNILGEYADITPKEIYDWPISYIQEYVNRCKYLGSEKALESMKELEQRIKNIDEICKKPNKEFRITN